MSLISLSIEEPDVVGLDSDRWQRILNVADSFCESDLVPAIALQVQHRGLTTGVHAFGRQFLEQSMPVHSQTHFLIASLTKPIISMAILRLVEEGELLLNERVSALLPEFKGGDKRPITVRHLLTHTSGLPDLLPNNEELRKAKAGLEEFVQQTCDSPLLFPPGKAAQYQSMGFALLGPIISRVTGTNYQKFIQQEIFEPLGMDQTWIGIPSAQQSVIDIAEVRVPERQRQGEDWNWNSSYWRELGAPWGGVISTVEDLSRFCRAMMTGGRTATGQMLFSLACRQEAMGNRLHDFPEISEGERRTRGWGYGWRLNWKQHRGTFGDLIPGDVVGHWGASGCLFWIDRQREIAAVLLSTEPVETQISPLAKISNMISAAFE